MLDDMSKLPSSSSGVSRPVQSAKWSDEAEVLWDEMISLAVSSKKAKEAMMKGLKGRLFCHG